MPWETIFSIANYWVLPFWLLLALGPRGEMTGKIILYGGIAPVALCYAILLPAMMGGLIDSGGGDGGAPDFSSLAGVMALFAAKGGATIGWIHYLAFDLFVGLWVARNADRHGYARWMQIIILVFVLMAGPLGLMLYLLLRATCREKPENAVLPH